MGDWSELLNGPLAGLGFGGAAGAVVGYAAKKMTKLVAILLGVLFILIQALVYLGWITVHWEAVQTAAEGVWRGPQGVTLAQRAIDVITFNLPFGGGFLVGFAIGFKLG